MLQSSVISPPLSHILGRLYSVVLIIKPYMSEARELKLCEPKLEAILKTGGLVSLYLVSVTIIVKTNSYLIELLKDTQIKSFDGLREKQIYNQ